MINYIEKGIELHEEIARQGYNLYQLDGVWVADDEVAVQFIIDNFVPVNSQSANWDGFNLQMMSNPRFNQVYNQCLQLAPIVANSLPTALDQVTSKPSLSLFTLIWGQLCAIGGATAEDKIVWGEYAIANYLPQDFIAVLVQ